MLPESEAVLLASLDVPAQRARARELFAAGWSLSAIGDACRPPRSRSTVQSWVSSSPPLSSSSPSSSSSSSLPITAAEFSHLKTENRTVRRRAEPFDPLKPKLDSGVAATISMIAPLARRYRSGSSPTGEYARANSTLSRICKDEFARGVSIRELSDAAGVTYKAMEKRVKR